MAKKKIMVIATALIAVIFSALTGCATAPATGGTEPSAAVERLTAAEQLAADLNAAKPGSTVTLSGWAGLNTALTVPEGVTLDLTAEGAVLELRDGAVLTVNGTVNAKAEGIKIDSVAANPAAINGSGTIYLKSKGCLLGIWEGRKLTLDGVTLVGLPDNGKPVVEMGNGGEFVLKSGVITGNTVNREGAAGGGVRVWENGTFTMQGGAITGNSCNGSQGSEGGGVFVDGGTFTMEGGEISGNTAKGERYASGGGVYVGGRSASVFIMKGGTIAGNSAISNGENKRGGGVCVNADNATFIMEGGTIYGSSAEGGNANTAVDNAALRVEGTVKWGTGGTYTKGGVPQSGGSDIGDSDDTLIAVPGQ